MVYEWHPQYGVVAKCEFGKSQIQFLDYSILTAFIVLSPDKVIAIVPKPRMSYANYRYGKLLPDLYAKYYSESGFIKNKNLPNGNVKSETVFG